MSKFSAESFLNAVVLFLCVSVISSAPVATQVGVIYLIYVMLYLVH